MLCPHCRVDFHDKQSLTYLGGDTDGHWSLIAVTCSSCERFLFFLQNGKQPATDGTKRFVGFQHVISTIRVHPKGSTRPPVPGDVPKDIAEDYTEACLVLADSPKASAALSRRCLQHLLRTAGSVKPGDLAGEIQQVLDSRTLPSALADSIDAIRNTGNFSAHPLKSTTTGAVLPVEPHEAEWNLDVLESLFDFYFVQPAIIAAKRAALNAKLASAGKPPMKK